MPHADARFGGSMPQLYDHYLVPLIFQPYADDLAGRRDVYFPQGDTWIDWWDGPATPAAIDVIGLAAVPAGVRIDGRPAPFETSAHRVHIPLPDENVKRVDFAP